VRRTPTAETSPAPEGRASWALEALAQRGIRPADLRFAICLGVLLGLSPLTGAARTAPSVALGSLAAVAALALRRGRPQPPASRAPTLARPSAAVGLVLAAAAAAFAPTLVWLFREYRISIWHNADGFFVAAAMALLARSALRRDGSEAPEASAWGFALLVPALALAVFDAGLRSGTLSAVALVLALPGLSLLLLGARRTRLLALPLALGVFLVPIPAAFEDPLGFASASAALVEPLVRALGIEAHRHETAFRLSTGWLGIGGNCSGLSTLHAGVALAGLFAFTARSRARRLLLLAMVVPIALVVNGARVAGLVVLCDRFGMEMLGTPLHGLSGIASFWLAVGALWLLADRPAVREALR
jgi:exosortase